MTLDEIIRALEALDPINGGDRQTMLDLDAEIALAITKPWRGATLEIARLCDSDRTSGSIVSWLGWCVLTREANRIFFRRVLAYTSSLENARALWKWPPPDLIPAHPIPCCIAALKAMRGNGQSAQS